VINGDLSLVRSDKNVKYEGVLHFIDAIERETMSDSGSSLTMDEMMGRVSIGRGSRGGAGSSIPDQDLIFERDPLAGVKMEHSNVWL